MTEKTLYCRMPCQWLSDPSLCLFEWQTLIGGILALFAALLGARFLFKQIKQAEESRRDDIRRRHTAARIALPLTLLEITKIVQKIMANIMHALQAPDDEDYHIILDPVIISDVTVKSVHDFVETLDDQNNIRHIAELLSSLQILNSRYNSFDLKRADATNGLHNLILDCAKISLLNDAMYNYGRYVSEDSFSVIYGVSNSDTWDEIHKKASSLLFPYNYPDFVFEPLQDELNRRKERNLSPWLEKFQP